MLLRASRRQFRQRRSSAAGGIRRRIGSIRSSTSTVRLPGGRRAHPPRHRTLGRDRARAPIPADVARRLRPRSSTPCTPPDGIVLRSSIRDGGTGEAGALLRAADPERASSAMPSPPSQPSTRSARGTSRPTDITAPTIGISERLQDSRAKIEGLLAQLAGRRNRRRARRRSKPSSEPSAAAPPRLRSRLADLSRRANFSHVSLRIETGEAPTAARWRHLGHRRRSPRRRPHPRHRRRSHPRRPRRSSSRWPCSSSSPGSPIAPGSGPAASGPLDDVPTLPAA